MSSSTGAGCVRNAHDVESGKVNVGLVDVEATPHGEVLGRRELFRVVAVVGEREPRLVQNLVDGQRVQTLVQVAVDEYVVLGGDAPVRLVFDLFLFFVEP